MSGLMSIGDYVVAILLFSSTNTSYRMYLSLRGGRTDPGKAIAASVTTLLNPVGLIQKSEAGIYSNYWYCELLESSMANTREVRGGPKGGGIKRLERDSHRGSQQQSPQGLAMAAAPNTSAGVPIEGTGTEKVRT